MTKDKKMLSLKFTSTFPKYLGKFVWFNNRTGATICKTWIARNFEIPTDTKEIQLSLYTQPSANRIELKFPITTFGEINLVDIKRGRYFIVIYNSLNNYLRRHISKFKKYPTLYLQCEYYHD